MSDLIIQPSFNSGEWSPKLYARVDLAKYRSGAALLSNWFVDYRGGATTRPGTKYILQCKNSASAVRLIPFQASFTVNYVLEFGDRYVRFFNNGAPILESTIAITNVSRPDAVTTILSVNNTYAVGDWIFISGVVGMTQLNGNYYYINARTATTITIRDLNNQTFDNSSFGAYVSGGTVQRVYTITSPYLASELALLKFSQNVNALIICHPNHAPYQLTLITATNWTLSAITFGATIIAPLGLGSQSNVGGTGVYYAYVVTSVDANGQESAPSTFIGVNNTGDLRTTAGSISVTWSVVPAAAVSFNVYKAPPSYAGPIPAGAMFGFIGNSRGNSFTDSNISPDFSQPPPVPQSPFSGSGVQSLTLTSGGGSYTSVPNVNLTAAPPGGTTATAAAALGITISTLIDTGRGYVVGQLLYFPFGVVLQVLAVDGLGGITSHQINNPGSLTSGPIPTNPVTSTGSNVPGFPTIGQRAATCNFTWNVQGLTLTNPGTGYLVTPSVIFTPAGATATATLGAAAAGNPTVPGFFQQRMVMAGPVGNPQQFNISQPGSNYNFNTTDPVLPENAISGSLVSGQLNTIKALIPQPQGLIILSDKQAWLINGGSPGSAISAINIVANPQAFNGCNDVPPIVANANVLYVQAKSSTVRNLIFDFYRQLFTGEDITVLSSHLFQGLNVLEWAFAEEPFKLVWGVRDDGVILCLTFLKEQELVAWTHGETQGQFKSVCSVTEQTTNGSLDATYFVIQRIINGNTVQYIERLSDIFYPSGLTDAWQVDAGLQYNGTSTLTFSGASHLSGETVTGLATDNLGNVTIITPFVMSALGNFTLPAPTPVGSTGYTRVTLGIAYECDLQTLPLDLGEPTVQGKVKKINSVVVRVADTLGLNIGQDFDNLYPMKDLIRGNVSSMLTGQASQIVTNLVSGDAREFLSPAFTVPGQYCIRQSDPFPATILGVIPDIIIGDVGNGKR